MYIYNLEERKASISLLFAALIIGNRNLSDKRKSYFEGVARWIGAYNEIIEEALDKTQPQTAISVFKLLPEREKCRMFIVMYQIMVLDSTEQLTDREKQFLEYVNIEAGIKQAMINTGMIKLVSKVSSLL